MVGRRLYRIIPVCLLLAVTVSTAGAQRSKYDPAGSQPAKQRDSFVDFALKQINPSDKDYGECIAEARRIALSRTVENTLYWSNLVTLGLFALSLFVLAYQVREQGRREHIVAGILCQYHNGWLRARGAANDLSAKYNALVASVNTAAESQLRQPTPQVTTPAGGAQRSPAIAVAPAGNASNRGNGPRSVAAPRPPTATATPVREVDLISSNNALQQQLDLARQREQNLRQQLNISEQKLEDERRRNRGLKGG
jgi:hypothetical protein